MTMLWLSSWRNATVYPLVWGPGSIISKTGACHYGATLSCVSKTGVFDYGATLSCVSKTGVFDYTNSQNLLSARDVPDCSLVYDTPDHLFAKAAKSAIRKIVVWIHKFRQNLFSTETKSQYNNNYQCISLLIFVAWPVSEDLYHMLVDIFPYLLLT